MATVGNFLALHLNVLILGLKPRHAVDSLKKKTEILCCLAVQIEENSYGDHIMLSFEPSAPEEDVVKMS